MDSDQKSHTRRHRLTPDRLVIALLVLECLLWLSQRFGELLGSNRHKGWAVTGTVMLVGAGLAVLFMWFLRALLLQRTFQFSIRSLLLAAVVVAIPSSWLATELRQAKTQRQAIAAIHQLKGEVYKNGQEHWPQFLRDWLSDEFFGTTWGVTWYSSKLTDEYLVILESLPDLYDVGIKSPLITDAGLKHLEGLKRLRELSIWDSQVTGPGLELLPDLNTLLIADDRRFTDTGLDFVKRHANLDALGLHKTAITDAGLEKIQSLSCLIYVGVGGTNVTRAAVAKFRQSHPNCYVDF